MLLKCLRKSQALFLVFEGVRSAFFVWIDGKYLGYSQDSFTPGMNKNSTFNLRKAEWRIDLALSTDKKYHTIAVKVLRWCDGSYLVTSIY